LEFRFSFWGENLVQNRAIGALAALGFPNGAESGARNRNWYGMQLLRARVIVCEVIYSYNNAKAIVNGSLSTLKLWKAVENSVRQ
jgi:hypothetical protein